MWRTYIALRSTWPRCSGTPPPSWRSTRSSFPRYDAPPRPAPQHTPRPVHRLSPHVTVAVACEWTGYRFSPTGPPRCYNPPPPPHTHIRSSPRPSWRGGPCCSARPRWPTCPPCSSPPSPTSSPAPGCFGCPVRESLPNAPYCFAGSVSLLLTLCPCLRPPLALLWVPSPAGDDGAGARALAPDLDVVPVVRLEHRSRHDAPTVTSPPPHAPAKGIPLQPRLPVPVPPPRVDAHHFCGGEEKSLLIPPLPNITPSPPRERS